MSSHLEESTRPDTTLSPETGSFIEVVGGVVAASIVIPFMQAFAGKAGEDAYQAVRDLIRRLKRSGEPVSLYDPATDTKLVVVSPPPDEAIKQLVGMPQARLWGHVATWDADAGVWRISVPAPPEIVAPDEMMAPETTAGPGAWPDGPEDEC
jgi:hypothetical protein